MELPDRALSADARLVARTTRRATLRTLLRMGGLALALAPLCAWIAVCSRGGSRYRPRERVPTTPIQASDRERSAKFTYYLASITQKGTTVVVDMDLSNGHARGFQFVTVWITLVGTKGEKQRINYAAGGVGAHSQTHVVARSNNVVFEVETIDVGLQIR